MFTHTGDSVVLKRLVDVDGDTGVGTVVRAREADRRGLFGAPASNLELCTLHVELGAGVGARRVESCKLRISGS